MADYKKFFKEKKITIMGLGLLGRGVGDAVFLAECGAVLTITDLKTREQLKESLKKLKNFTNIKYVLGEHRLEDFRNCDMVLKSAGVPLDSVYIKEARKHKIPVEMDVSLLLKYASGIKMIGVTGTRGKSITTALIYQILKNNEKFLKNQVYIGGNVRGVATLPLLKKIKVGDILICELDSWQLQGFGDVKISPSISVFTSFMPDHMNYYKNNMKKYFADKANIFKYQKKGDLLVIRPDVRLLIPKNIKSRVVVVRRESVNDFRFSVPGDHHKENLACAVCVAENLGIPLGKIKQAVAKFTYLEGRFQFMKNYKGRKIYNDNNATTPEATMVGVEALKSQKKNVALICGGSDKGLVLDNLVKTINQYCRVLITIPGNGTDRLLSCGIKTEIYQAKDLQSAVNLSLQNTKKGDIIVFSPAFASFSTFKNEYDRGDQFIKIITSIHKNNI